MYYVIRKYKHIKGNVTEINKKKIKIKIDINKSNNIKKE